MKSGAMFSLIFVIWLIGILIAFYMLFPDISRSLRSMNTIDIRSVNELEKSNLSSLEPKEELVSYTPLGIFDLIKN